MSNLTKTCSFLRNHAIEEDGISFAEISSWATSPPFDGFQLAEGMQKLVDAERLRFGADGYFVAV